MKKAYIVIFTIILCIFLISIVSVIASKTQNEKEINMKKIGEKIKEIKDSIDSDEIIMTINDMEITKKQLDTFIFLNELNGLSENEVIDRYIYNQLLYEQSIKLGYKVSEEEIDSYITESKRISKSDEEGVREGNKIFQEYLEGASLTEEEYWEESKPVIKKYMLVGKLKKQLKEDYFKNKGDNANVYDNKTNKDLEKY